jgi:hypothetical protein
VENSHPSPPPLPTHPAVGAVQLFLSLALSLFVVDALLCLLDASMQLFFQSTALTFLRDLVALSAFLTGLLVYVLIGLTPLVPKRYFLPLTLFPLVAGMAQLPLLAFYFHQTQKIVWATSLCHVLLTLGVVFLLQRRSNPRWPLVPRSAMGGRIFSAGHLGLFIFLNLFVLLPTIVGISATSASRAIHHLSDGFISLRPSGLIMQARTYRRDSDGATVHLIPMSHVAQSSFYTKLVESFPADSVILAEGVSDKNSHFKTKIGYGKTAASLGLAEQQTVFKPQVTSIPADVDLSDLSPITLDFVKNAMALHNQGINAQSLPALMENPPPHLLQSLLDDLLHHRNRHLLHVLETQLAQSKTIIIPWGAAHMPGIAEGVLKMGFYQIDSREHVAIPLLR